MDKEISVAEIESNLEELIGHKDLAELQLMKLKCDVREQKNRLNKLRKEEKEKLIQEKQQKKEQKQEQLDEQLKVQLANKPSKPIKVKKNTKKASKE